MRTDRIRVILNVKKLDNLSKEEFTRMWFEYGEAFKALPIVQKNLVKYEQVRSAVVVRVKRQHSILRRTKTKI